MSRTVRVKAVTRVANCAVAIESPMQLACERVGQGKIQVDEVIEERTFAHFGIEGPTSVVLALAAMAKPGAAECAWDRRTHDAYPLRQNALD